MEKKNNLAQHYRIVAWQFWFTSVLGREKVTPLFDHLNSEPPIIKLHTFSTNSLALGASGDSVDLLPSPWQADWTKSLPTDDGHLMDQIFSFDGEHNAVEVPAGHFDHHLGDHFTISTWMKHDFPEGGPVKSHNAPKEHILCMSDGDGECVDLMVLMLI